MHEAKKSDKENNRKIREKTVRKFVHVRHKNARTTVRHPENCFEHKALNYSAPLAFATV